MGNITIRLAVPADALDVSPVHQATDDFKLCGFSWSQDVLPYLRDDGQVGITPIGIALVIFLQCCEFEQLPGVVGNDVSVPHKKPPHAC